MRKPIDSIPSRSQPHTGHCGTNRTQTPGDQGGQYTPHDGFLSRRRRHVPRVLSVLNQKDTRQGRREYVGGVKGLCGVWTGCQCNDVLCPERENDTTVKSATDCDAVGLGFRFDARKNCLEDWCHTAQCGTIKELVNNPHCLCGHDTEQCFASS